MAIGSLAVLAAGVAGVALWWASRGDKAPVKSASVPQTSPALVPPPAAAPPQAAPSAPAAAAAAAAQPATAQSVDATTPKGADQISEEIRVQFQRIVAAQTPGFVVEASATKPVLKIGKDLFSWRIRSPRDGFVHILGLGPEGTLLLLFPNSQDRKNRIRAGQTLTLPRDSWLLGAAEPPGREELLVFVSAQPRSYDGLGTKYLDSFLQLPTGDAATAVKAGWRHETPWLMGAVLNCQGDTCLDYGAASVTVEVRQ